MFMHVWKEKGRKVFLSLMAFAFLLVGGIWYAKEYTTVGNSVNGREMPVCSVETEEKEMALTFETAWGEERTGEILDLLKKEGVRATFFVTESWMRNHPELIARMKEEGHDIGTLGVSHEDLSQKTGEEQRSELREAKKAAHEYGISMEFFRPPYGNYNDSLIRTAWEEGFYTVRWSVDSMDWKNYGPESLIQTVTKSKEFGSGAIVRLNSEAEDTKGALKELIRMIQKKGYHLVPVSELIHRGKYHMDVNGRQIPGLT